MDVDFGRSHRCKHTAKEKVREIWSTYDRVGSLLGGLIRRIYGLLLLLIVCSVRSNRRISLASLCWI